MRIEKYNKKNERDSYNRELSQLYAKLMQDKLSFPFVPMVYLLLRNIKAISLMN